MGATIHHDDLMPWRDRSISRSEVAVPPQPSRPRPTAKRQGYNRMAPFPLRSGTSSSNRLTVDAAPFICCYDQIECSRVGPVGPQSSSAGCFLFTIGSPLRAQCPPGRRARGRPRIRPVAPGVPARGAGAEAPRTPGCLRTRQGRKATVPTPPRIHRKRAYDRDPRADTGRTTRCKPDRRSYSTG